MERPVRDIVTAALSKWFEIAGLLYNRRFPLKNRANIYDVCIRSVTLYRAESWPFTQRLEKCIQSCNKRVLRYMSGVPLRDRVSSTEVAQRCGLKVILEVNSVRSLQ